MDKSFYSYIFEKQAKAEAVPSNAEIAKWAIRLIRLLFPQQASQKYTQEQEIIVAFDEIKTDLHSLLNTTQACKECNHEEVVREFMNGIPELYRILKTDIEAILTGDPAANNEFEVVRTYPGFFAISFYRIANKLLRLKTPLIPRILTEYAHSKTGIDIHPGATIGEYLYIDHGTGIVIGETSVIGNNVKIYQGVTIGALLLTKETNKAKRHPTIEDDVI